MPKSKVKKTRNLNTETESMYWGKLRSALRRHYRFWKPATSALNAASRPSKSKNKRLKKEYQCAKCKKWFARKDVQIDHVVPCGSLKSYADIGPFLKRLTPEDESAFELLCKPCHQTKTNNERKLRK